MIELLFLLLPVAAASGWWLARRDGSRRREDPRGAAPAFLRGLDYLLDEQPDKAIDVFLKLAEVDGETVETHLALGSLFRRRGEVDRAIRIHQNLIARDNLSREQRGFALFELGQDYMRAGLFDRAELLFQEVVELGLHRGRALRGLLDIYQQERDWLKCLEVAERLKPLAERPMGTEIAQYRCELAEEARRQGETAKARKHLMRAQAADPGCVRAAMLEGHMALGDGQPEVALELFLRLADRDTPLVSEILPDLTRALRALGRDEMPVLETLVARHPSPPLILALSDAVLQKHDAEAASAILTRYLKGHADLVALERLLDLQSRASPQGEGPPDGGGPVQGATAQAGLLDGVGDGAPSDPGGERHRVILDVVRHLLSRQPVYQCEHCGFSARSLHWQCPSCKRWATVLPVQPDPILGGELPQGPRIA